MTDYSSVPRPAGVPDHFIPTTCLKTVDSVLLQLWIPYEVWVMHPHDYLNLGIWAPVPEEKK